MILDRFEASCWYTDDPLLLADNDVSSSTNTMSKNKNHASVKTTNRCPPCLLPSSCRHSTRHSRLSLLVRYISCSRLWSQAIFDGRSLLTDIKWHTFLFSSSSSLCSVGNEGRTSLERSTSDVYTFTHTRVFVICLLGQGTQSEQRSKKERERERDLHCCCTLLMLLSLMVI